MRILLLFATVITLFPGAHVTANSRDGYLIIRATVAPEEERQPTWIALYRGRAFGQGTLIHVPADGAVVKVRAGKYWILHVDFGSRHRGRGTVGIKYEPFTVKPETTYFVGHIVLVKEAWYKYNTESGDTVALLRDACLKEPELLKRLPMYAVGYKEEAVPRPCAAFEKTDTP